MMANLEPVPGATPDWELRFQPLTRQGPALVFPCDERGNVWLDSLGNTARWNYLFARRMIRREFAEPCVIRRE